jgi:hypothetical protein
MRRGRCRRGQVWSADYTVGFVLFLLTLFLVMGTLSRTLLVQDTFPEIRKSTVLVSQQLMGEGYPSDWREEDLLLAGLISEGALSMRKAEELASLSADSYTAGKSAVGTKYEWAVMFSWPNGTLQEVGGRCSIGSPAVTETKTLDAANLSVAYYTSNGGGLLSSNMSSINATIYAGSQFSQLFNESFDMMILEDANLSSLSSPYDAEKAQLLESYVAAGGRLLIIGNLNLSELFSMNITEINGTDDAIGQASDTLFNLSGIRVENLTGFAITEQGERRFTEYASIDSTRSFAASFTHGDGDLYFLGSLDGTINTTGELLAEHLFSQIKTFRSIERANCAAVELPSETRNRAVIHRLLAYEGKILDMEVVVWE